MDTCRAAPSTRLKIKMDTNPVMENNTALYQQLFKEFFDKYVARNMDLVTVRTIKIHLVVQILKELNLPLKMLIKLFKTHTVLHEEFTDKLLEKADEDVRSVLAQKFVKNEKLVRILKDATKEESKLGEVEQFLALDGLHGNLTNGPNFEYKHYLTNLIIPTDVNAPAHLFDDNAEYKRKHVHGVRAMYEETRRNGKARIDPMNIYVLMSRIVYDKTKLELPKVKDEDFHQLDGDLYRAMEQAYLNNVDAETIQMLVKSLRYRAEKRGASCQSSSSSSDEEVTVGGKAYKIKAYKIMP